MRSAQQIYDEYKIMPALQLHQLRVAAVAKFVCDGLEKDVNTDHVVLACLFHDMGNIIKMDLTRFPEFRAEKGQEYWEGVKASFIERYGEKSHEGNVAIAKEIGLPSAVIALVDGVSFSNIGKIVAGTSFDLKIVEYADCRVGPHGVLSLKERLAEARSRYLGSGKSYYTEEGFALLAKSAEELEAQIFERVSRRPEDINDAAIASLLDELRNYVVA